MADAPTLARAELIRIISDAMVSHKPEDGPPSVHIAAAVVAHLESDAVVERAYAAFWETPGTNDECIRAAIRAAVT